MTIWQSLAGTVVVEMVSADVAGTLRAVTEAGVAVSEVEPKDVLTLRCRVARRCLAKLERLCEARGDKVTVLAEAGAYFGLARLLHRPVFLLGLAFLLALSAFLPTRVLEIRVEGNETVPAREIVSAAEGCGVFFGASRRAVRSERVKNALLEAIPALQWVGVNTRGSVAVISVRERTAASPEENRGGVSRIVARQDGVITACTVLRGTALCRVGQAVRAGQTLVSGYTDCGIAIRAERAEAEIYARTEREVTVVMPVFWTQRSDTGREVRRWAVRFGNNRINFYSGSGNPGGSCGKITTEYPVTLPGGLTLPVCLIHETWFSAEQTEAAFPAAQARTVLTEAGLACLRSRTVGGRILSADETAETAEGCYRLTGRYACEEMIGQEHSEEIDGQNGETG